MNQLVATVQTTPTMVQYAHALLLAWPEATIESNAVLYAQFALETGAGKFCWNWNLGNVKHVNGDGFDYVALKGVFEYVNGVRKEIPQSDPGSWFRVYPNLDTAMAEHFTFLKTHYAPAWDAVVSGSLQDFAQKLHDHGYFTASAASYTAGMTGYYTSFMKTGAFESAAAHVLDETTPPAMPDFATIHPDIEWEPIKYQWDDVARRQS